MAYPDHRTYAVLYARFFKPERMEALLEGLPIEGNSFLDLCCGDGKVTFEALKRGASSAFAVDECRQMISEALYKIEQCPSAFNDMRVIICPDSVKSVLRSWPLVNVRVVVCQQAINYWLDRETAEYLANIMEPDGIFAFNTFNRCPPRIPRVMAYQLDGRQYCECSYYIGGFVHHVQACEGIPPHVTAFQWLSEEAIREILEGLFEVKVQHDGTSSIYHCRSLH